MMRRAKLFLGSSACGLVVSASLLQLCCSSKSADGPSDQSLVIFVTIAPQAYFVERVAGEHARVEVLVAPGQSYHTFEPTQRQIAAISASRVYFGIGVPFEAGIKDRIGSVGDRIKYVDTSEAIDRRPGVECFHDVGDESAHHHHDEEGDPHIWLDPRIVKKLAGRIEQTLSELDPEHAGEYRKNLTTFEGDLDAAHSRLTELLAPCRGKEFFVFHPSFGYFGDAYGLKQVAIEEGGKERAPGRYACSLRRPGRAAPESYSCSPSLPSRGPRPSPVNSEPNCTHWTHWLGTISGTSRTWHERSEVHWPRTINSARIRDSARPWQP